MSTDSTKIRSVKWWWISALVVFVVGMTAALIGVQRDQELIADLVRTPSGCVSTIEISATGRYYVYVETKGTIDEIGPCNNDARDFVFDTPPEVAVTLQSAGGEAVELRPDDSVEYNAPDFIGKSVATFVISEPGTFTLVMQSSDLNAVIAVGRNAAMTDGILLISGASLILVALALLILAIIATRARRRARHRAEVGAGSEVYVTYQTATTPPSAQVHDAHDMWAPPRPEDRAGR